MVSFEVGKLYQPGVNKYREESKVYMTPSGIVLEVFYNKPTSKEIKEFKSGVFQSDLFQFETIQFFLFRFGTTPWIDAPYNVNINNLNMDDVQKPVGDTEGYLISVYLVDASTGILKVIRTIGANHNFSVKLYDALKMQELYPFSIDNYYYEINQAYQKWKTSEMVEIANKH